MQPPDQPSNETERVQALLDLAVLETPGEERFDRITRVAKRHFGVAIALVSLVDSERQWFKSRQCLDAEQTPRDISFCGHAILGEAIFQIPDAQADPRFADNPLVTGPPHIRFYAGAPLHAPGGERVGTLCIIDDQPQAFSEDDLTVLRDLADAVETELAREELARSQEKLKAREEQLQSVLNTAPDGILNIDSEGLIQTFNPAAEAIFGYSAEQMVGQSVDCLLAEPGTGDSCNSLKAPLAERYGWVSGQRRELAGRRKDGTTFPMEIAVTDMDLNGKSMVTAIVRDITERKEAEEERNRLLSILEATPDFVGMADAEGQPVYYNPAAQAMLGSGAAAAGRFQDIETYYPQWAWRVIQDEAFPQARETGQWRGETALLGDEGREIPVSQVLIGLSDSEGRVTHYATIMHDLSTQKEREAELRQLGEILEASPDFISMAEPDGTLLYVNDGGRRLIGLPTADSDGGIPADVQCSETAGEWGHPDWASRKIREQGIPSAIEAGAWEGETALIDADGREIPVSQLILAHRDGAGSLIRLSTIMRDISRHKALEDRLQQRQTALQRLQSATTDPESSFETKIEALLRLGADYFGLPYAILSRIEGQAYWIQQAVSPDGALAPGQHFDLGVTYCTHTLAAGGPTGFPHAGASAIADHPCYRTQGMEAYLGTPIRVEGETYGTLNFSAPEPREDFSDFELGLLELMGQWVSGELTRATYQQAVETSNAELEQFAYAISHDLKEPLRSVSGYLNLLRRRFGDQLPEKAAGYMAAAEEGGNRMARMIEDLLDYSRIKRLGEAFGPVPLDEVLGDALHNLASVREETGATIESEPLPTVAGDRGQLMRLFQNLLGNALKYRDPERPPVIHVALHDRGSHWEIVVADNGIGIEPAQTDRVFEVFQRLHNRETYEGTGAGMALARRIVDRHGGTIWVESEGEGQGSTFRLTLPKTGMAA